MVETANGKGEFFSCTSALSSEAPEALSGGFFLFAAVSEALFATRRFRLSSLSFWHAVLQRYLDPLQQQQEQEIGTCGRHT